MNDQHKKRHAQERALKDALVAQVLALRDEEVALQAAELGERLDAAQASVQRMRETAERMNTSASSTVIPFNTARTSGADGMAPSRRQMRRPMRLVASVEPPTSTPDPEDPGRDPDQS
jgi:hypothetical protein